MAVNLSPVGGVAAQFFNNDGTVLSGGKIYTYAAGTTTNQTTYTSSNGGTAHSNPIILDSAGRVPGGEIWLTDGISYKFVLNDSTGALIATYDNIIGINSNFVNFTNEQEIQTATAGQTVFTLTTMQYQPGTGSLSVFVDGVNQYGPGAQYAYIETSSTVVTFISGLHVGASVKFTTSAINASSYGDAFVISYTPPFTSSVATNVGDKLAQTVSVMDFGAVGDGTTDDTAAIQAAINYANSVLVTGLDTVTYAAIQAIYFPHGVYKITSTLNLGGYAILEGDEAVIKQVTAGQDIFASGSLNLSSGDYISGNAYLITIRGFTFVGGQRHIVLANNNLDSNQLRIESCQFFGSSNYSLALYAVSGQFDVNKCKFINNYQIARLVNDMKSFTDCWFESGNNTANLGQIINKGGTLLFQRCLGVPNNAALTSARWVDDYSNSVQAHSCRFGDEGGNGGWPFIYAYGSVDASTRYSPSIVIRDTYAAGGGLSSGRSDASIIYCTYPALDGNKHVPPVIIIDNLSKIESFSIIATNMSTAEINTALASHTGIVYYDINNVQFEQYGTYATMPLPIYQRALKRTESSLQSVVGTNQIIFQEYVTQQMLSALGSSMTIKYSGYIANSAAAKNISLYFNGSVLTNATYTPATNAATYFSGEIKLVANGLTALLISHAVTDQTGVKVVDVANITGLNLPITEYIFTINTTCSFASDVQILSLDLVTKI